jgi:small subunit ribosomal protein S20
MPTSRSAKKTLRQNFSRAARNRAVKTAMRSQVRKVREAIATGDVQASQAELRIAQKKLDQAAAGKVIHSNTAARTKSRLVAAIKKLQSA